MILVYLGIMMGSMAVANMEGIIRASTTSSFMRHDTSDKHLHDGTENGVVKATITSYNMTHALYAVEGIPRRGKVTSCFVARSDDKVQGENA